MSKSTAEAGTTTRDRRGLAAALTTDAQAFGHKPNGRHIYDFFLLENIGFSQNAYRSSPRKPGGSYDIPNEGEGAPLQMTE